MPKPTLKTQGEPNWRLVQYDNEFPQWAYVDMQILRADYPIMRVWSRHDWDSEAAQTFVPVQVEYGNMISFMDTNLGLQREAFRPERPLSNLIDFTAYPILGNGTIDMSRGFMQQMERALDADHPQQGAAIEVPRGLPPRPMGRAR